MSSMWMFVDLSFFQSLVEYSRSETRERRNWTRISNVQANSLVTRRMLGIVECEKDVEELTK